MKKCFTFLSGYQRVILCIFLFMALAVVPGCTPSDAPTPNIEEDALTPVLFIHGGAGSAAQFESQAQRFMANGYPADHIAVFEYNSSLNVEDEAETRNAQINAIIDTLLAASGAKKVNLLGHSMGTQVSFNFLSDPDNAARVAHYVSIDGRACDAPPGGVPTLALWGQYVDREITGAAENVYPDPANPIGHIESCTAAQSFERMYEFFNGEAPEISDIPIAEGDTVSIAGKVAYFPANTGALGILEIYKLNADTAQRDGAALATLAIDAQGHFGPLEVEKGQYYEFAFEHAAGGKHYFYREPFMADNYFLRFNTSVPGAGIGENLSKTANHTSILVTRDKEMWGDQGASNDQLEIDGQDVLDSQAGVTGAALLKRLSGLFLMDWGTDKTAFSSPKNPANPPDQLTDLSAPIGGYFALLPFMSAFDVYIPANPARAVTLKLTPRGGKGFAQVIKVPAWQSDTVRVSVHFRDFVRIPNPVVFVHGYAGSASQFESQAQRFMANGYPKTYLHVYENDTSGATQVADQVPELDAVIDAVLASTGATKVDLIGHSRGTYVSQSYLAVAENAAKVAHYVNVDGRTATELPGGVATLALWGEGTLTREIVDATNVYLSDQAHIQVCTSAESFASIFPFFTSRAAAATAIPDAFEETIEIAGRINYFPVNVGAPGTLEVYEINPLTTERIGSALATYNIDALGNWGPLSINKGATLEFAFEHAGSLGRHYFYREALWANNYFIRLNTSNPNDATALGNKMSKSALHTDILISRDKELWGDQETGNDILIVDGINLFVTAGGTLAAARAKRLSGLFLMDWGPDKSAAAGDPGSEPDQLTDLTEVISAFNLPFMSGLDLFMASGALRVIPVELTPRGGAGAKQTVRVPNLASNEIRVSVHFRDFVRPALEE